ncbi:MAG TPA: hypothetical protein VFP13_07480 [Actinomycetota bacterium]|nr:hypothetical protein [Actinomycetota bacterium]
MGAVLGPLAVGGPHVMTADGWDPAPLLLAVVVVALLRWVGIPIRLPIVLLAVLAGLALDLMTDVSGVSMITTISVLVLVAALVSLRRATSP